jgi:hypothetical protein
MRFRLPVLLVFLAATPDRAQATCAPGKLARIAVAAQLSRTAETLEVMHCLKAGDLDWLGDSPMLDRAKWLRVGLRHDRKTYPGEDVLFVVVFENRVKGDVFELTREDTGRHRTYTVVNNGSIDPRRKGLEWVGDVLGGIWTREYIARNAMKVMHGPKVWVQLKTVFKPLPQVTCTSYVSQHEKNK